MPLYIFSIFSNYNYKKLNSKQSKYYIINIKSMPQFKGIVSKENASKIIGIQFSVLSPEEIRKSSVADKSELLCVVDLLVESINLKIKL